MRVDSYQDYLQNGVSATTAPPAADDSFQLYDLRVEVVCPPGKRIMCGAAEGDHFVLEGEMLRLPPGQGFSIYSLGAVLPLLAAKQRVTHQNDWMTTDAEVACPDPHCPSTLRVVRTGVRTFRHGDVTVVPLRVHAREPDDGADAQVGLGCSSHGDADANGGSAEDCDLLSGSPVV